MNSKPAILAEISNSNNCDVLLTIIEKYIHKSLANVIISVGDSYDSTGYFDFSKFKTYKTDIVKTDTKYFKELIEENPDNINFVHESLFYVENDRSLYLDIITDAVENNLKMSICLNSIESDVKSYYDIKSPIIKKHLFTIIENDNKIFLLKTEASIIVDSYSTNVETGEKIPLDKNIIYCGVDENDFICGFDFNDSIDYNNNEDVDKIFPRIAEEIDINSNINNILKGIEKYIDSNNAILEIYFNNSPYVSSYISKKDSEPNKRVCEISPNLKNKGKFLYDINKSNITSFLKKVYNNQYLLNEEKYLVYFLYVINNDIFLNEKGTFNTSDIDKSILKVHMFSSISNDDYDKKCILYKNSTETLLKFLTPKRNLIFHGFKKDDIVCGFDLI